MKAVVVICLVGLCAASPIPAEKQSQEDVQSQCSLSGPACVANPDCAAVVDQMFTQFFLEVFGVDPFPDEAKAARQWPAWIAPRAKTVFETRAGMGMDAPAPAPPAPAPDMGMGMDAPAPPAPAPDMGMGGMGMDGMGGMGMDGMGMGPNPLAFVLTDTRLNYGMLLDFAQQAGQTEAAMLATALHDCLAALHTVTLEPFASGLYSPRGLTWYNNWVYVAEAGLGGTAFCVPAGEGPRCPGDSGRVTRIHASTLQSQVVATGILSIADTTNATAANPRDATGTSQVIFDAAGTPYVLVGYAYPASKQELVAAGVPAGAQGSTVMRGFSDRTVVADIFASEAANDPDGHGVDSNVFSGVWHPTRANELVIADAGGNAVYSVDVSTGAVTLRLVISDIERPCIPPGSFVCAQVPPGLPPGVGAPFCCGFFADKQTFPSNPVPTTILARPGHPDELYLGFLTGIFWHSNQASIHKLAASDLSIAEADFVTGFNTVISAAFDGPNSLYVLQHNVFGNAPYGASNQLVRVDMNTRVKNIVPAGFHDATKLMVYSGILYATNESTHMGGGNTLGTVVRVDLHKNNVPPGSELEL